MSLRLRAIVLVAALVPLSLPITALAGDAQLHLPAFDHLQRTATDSVNITIGHGLLSLAAFAMKHDRNAKDQEALEVLRGLKAVYVRSYEFADDNMYSKADVDSVRAQARAGAPAQREGRGCGRLRVAGQRESERPRHHREQPAQVHHREHCRVDRPRQARSRRGELWDSRDGAVASSLEEPDR
jgi:hypothetical protein